MSDLPHSDRSKLMDEGWYQATYDDVGGTDPARHFAERGRAEGRSPNRWIDPIWYHEVYPDVRNAGVDAASHYLEHGWREGRDPSPWFSGRAYLSSAHTPGGVYNPLLDVLGRSEGRGRFERAVKVEFLVRGEERRSLLVTSWRDELQARGFQACWDRASPGGLRSAARSAVGRLVERLKRNEAVIALSFNGAYLDAATLHHFGSSLVLVWDDPEAASAAAGRLGTALAMATSMTSSRAVEAILHGVGAGARTIWYPEPRLDAFSFQPPKARLDDIVWRLPHSCRGEADALPIEEVIRRVGGPRLRIIADLGWRDILADGTYGASVEFRVDWNEISCLRDCYWGARLALITPGAGRRAEVTVDAVAALAGGALPVLDYAISPEMLALLGADVPVPFYKSLDELEAIVDHFLSTEAERDAYALEGRRRVLLLPTYGSRIGSLMRHLGHSALASAKA